MDMFARNCMYQVFTVPLSNLLTLLTVDSMLYAFADDSLLIRNKAVISALNEGEVCLEL